MKYTKSYRDFIGEFLSTGDLSEDILLEDILFGGPENIDDYSTGIDDMLLDKDFLYKLSFNQFWNEEEGAYIRDVLSLNEEDDFLNEGEIKLLFFDYEEEALNEAMFPPPIAKKQKLFMPKKKHLVAVQHTNTIRPAKVKFAARIKNASIGLKQKVSGWLQKLSKKIKEYKDYVLMKVIGPLTVYTEQSKKFIASDAKTIYSKYKDAILRHEDVAHKIDLSDKIAKSNEQVSWATKVYMFIKTNVFDKLIMAVKDGIGRIINANVQEALLNGSLSIDYILNEADDHHGPMPLKAHNVHLHILKMIKKVDLFVHDKFKPIINAISDMSGFGIKAIVSLMSKLGGPPPPEETKLLGSCTTHMLHYYNTDVEYKASAWINPKTIFTKAVKGLVVATSIATVPLMSVYYTVVSIINKVGIVKEIARLAHEDEQKMLKS